MARRATLRGGPRYGRSVGVPPMSDECAGNAGETDETGASRFIRPFDPDDPSLHFSRRKGWRLPHWTATGATYGVTFRLGDSLPAPLWRQWKKEREDLRVRAEKGSLPPSERERLEALLSQKVSDWLDAGHGECWLRDDRIAQVVAEALNHFDGVRYDLDAWCVMPNHMHVIVRPRGACFAGDTSCVEVIQRSRSQPNSGEKWQVLAAREL